MPRMGNVPASLDTIDRFAKRGLWMCLLWPMLAAPAPRFAPPRVPPEIAHVPNLTIEEFDIEGQTLEEISASLSERLIYDPEMDDVGAAAVTYNWLGWEWDRGTGDNGGCRPANARVDVRFKLLLPRLVSSGHTPETWARWLRFRRAIEQHEARHVLITLDHARRIERAIAGSDCASAEAAAEKAKAQMQVEQDAFDNGQCAAFHSGDRSLAAIDDCVFPYLDSPLSDPSVAVHRPSS